MCAQAIRSLIPIILLLVFAATDARSEQALPDRLSRAHDDYLRSRSENVDLDALLAELEELAAEFEAAGEDSMAIQALRDAGDLHLRAGRLELCRERIESGISIAAGSDRLRDEADLRGTLAVSWAMAGDFEGMIAATREVLDLARELGDKDLERRCWFNTGVAYTKLGRTPEALVAIRNALLLTRELNNVQRMASAYSMVAELQFRMGQADLSRDSADSAVAYGRKFGDRLPLSAALLVRAAARAEIGELQAAWEDAQEAVELRRGSGLELYLPLALLSRARYELALEEYDACRQTVDELMPLAIEHGDPTQTMEAHLLSGLVELSTGQPEEAERELLALRDEYETLLEEIEDEASAAGLYQIGGEAYSALALLRVEQGDAELGWEALERGSALQLRRRLGAEDQVVRREDVQARLRDERALWLHFVDSKQMPLSVFVVSPDAIEFHQFGSWVEISAQCRDFVQRFVAGAEGVAIDQELLALSEVLLGPVSPMLEDENLDRVFVTLPSVLAGFPFELLPLPGDEQTTLGEQFAVSHVPYAGLLVDSRPDPGVESVLAVADPAFVVDESAPDLARLPHTRDEIAIFVGDGVESFVDKEATTAAVVTSLEASPPAVIHLATHAFVSPDVPENSTLVLAGEDGRLLAWQIEEWDLVADLVTLSACRTAVGYAYMGEGSFSLARSFLVAGARSVVSSLWDVEDQATARFMADFYGALAEGVARDEALRTARVLAAERGVSPRDRGAFVLTGVGWEPVPSLDGRVNTQTGSRARPFVMAAVAALVVWLLLRLARGRERSTGEDLA